MALASALLQVMTDAVRKTARPMLRDFGERYGYFDVFVISAAGDVYYTVARESDLGADLVQDEWARSGLGIL